MADQYRKSKSKDKSKRGERVKEFWKMYDEYCAQVEPAVPDVCTNEDLKKAKVGDKTLEEASQELNEKMNEKVGEGTAKVRTASNSRTSSSSGGITQHASV